MNWRLLAVLGAVFGGLAWRRAAQARAAAQRAAPWGGATDPVD